MATPSQFNFDTTDQRLEGAIAGRGLHLFAVVDHGAGAADAGLKLGRSRLYIFGNPKAGTAFMQANPEAGLELPLKALVYETKEGVFLATSDIRDAAARLDISPGQAPVAAVAGVLEAIVNEASGKASEKLTASAA